VVDSVEIEGVRSVDRGALESKLATQAAGALAGLFPWQEKPRLDEEALEVDRLRIEAFYRERGYYDARVEPAEVSTVRVEEPASGDDMREGSATIPQGERKVKVVFRVDEGRPVRIATVEVLGLDAAPEAKERVGELPIRAGQIFTESAYDAARAEIQRALLETGWATGQVTQSAQVLPEEHSVTVRYEVSAGPRYRFGQIFVVGTTAVPRDLVRDQALIEVKPGEPWQESKLALAHARVFGLGVFGGVRVARGTPDPEKGTIPVVVTVREAPFRTIRAGPGVGIEATRMDVHGIAGWTNRNTFGRLQRLSLDALVGWAWLPNFWAPDKQAPVGNVSAEWYQPGAISRRVDLSVRAEVERGIEPAYDFWSTRLRLGLPVRLAPRWTFFPSYNAELYDVYGDLLAGTEETELACNGNICFVSYLEQRIRWDGVDSPIETRRGWIVSLALQEGFRIGQYGYQYLRFLPAVEAFHPFGQHMVAAARVRLGALVPISEGLPPPITSRFFGGGPGSMRGFGTRRLAPYAQETDGTWAPVGGNGLFDASVELRVGVGAKLSGAFFVDVGNVSDYSEVPTAWQGALDLSALQWATGFGVRYSTPIGPIRADVALRLPTRWKSGQTWYQGLPTLPGLLPGDNEPTMAFHLTIGDSF
jgi:translocation and assembly module TamA